MLSRFTKSLIHRSCQVRLLNVCRYISGELRGLLGDFDGNKTNDFISRNGTHMSSDASMEVIHYDFGMSCKYPVKFYEIFESADFKHVYCAIASVSRLKLQNEKILEIAHIKAIGRTLHVSSVMEKVLILNPLHFNYLLKKIIF